MHRSYYRQTCVGLKCGIKRFTAKETLIISTLPLSKILKTNKLSPLSDNHDRRRWRRGGRNCFRRQSHCAGNLNYYFFQKISWKTTLFLLLGSFLKSNITNSKSWTLDLQKILSTKLFTTIPLTLTQRWTHGRSEEKEEKNTLPLLIYSIWRFKRLKNGKLLDPGFSSDSIWYLLKRRGWAFVWIGSVTLIVVGLSLIRIFLLSRFKICYWIWVMMISVYVYESLRFGSNINGLLLIVCEPKWFCVAGWPIAWIWDLWSEGFVWDLILLLVMCLLEILGEGYECSYCS